RRFRLGFSAEPAMNGLRSIMAAVFCLISANALAQGPGLAVPWVSSGGGTYVVRCPAGGETCGTSPWSDYAFPNGLWLAGDFNGDGKTDYVHAVANTDYVHVWLSQGNGTFTVSTFRPW